MIVVSSSADGSLASEPEFPIYDTQEPEVVETNELVSDINEGFSEHDGGVSLF
jgi:hypothetical protein